MVISRTTKLTLSLFALAITILHLLTACIPNIYPQHVSLKRASDVIGHALPVPSYLPEGYVIQGVYIVEIGTQVKTLDLTIANQHIGEKQYPTLKMPPEQMILQISWSISPSLGIKLEGERFDVADGRRGFEGAIFQERLENNQLIWDWTPDLSPDHPEHFEFQLIADKSISKEELVKIARSIH